MIYVLLYILHWMIYVPNTLFRECYWGDTCTSAISANSKQSIYWYFYCTLNDLCFNNSISRRHFYKPPTKLSEISANNNRSIYWNIYCTQSDLCFNNSIAGMLHEISANNNRSLYWNLLYSVHWVTYVSTTLLRECCWEDTSTNFQLMYLK